MNILQKSLILLLVITMITSCKFISNVFTYKKTTELFVESIINEDYENSLNYLALEHESAKDFEIEKYEESIVGFRKIVVENFGTEPHFSFMKATKEFSTGINKNMPANTTVAQIQIKNEDSFGILEIIFDDASGKILNISLKDKKYPIPSMTLFWIFGLFALCVPGFNIYVIILIKRSALKRKWLKYITVILLNVISLSYAPVNGFYINPLSFQFLLGASFNYMGYFNAAWTLSIPVGGLFWFWKIKIKKDKVSTNGNPELEISEQFTPVITEKDDTE